MPRKHPITQMQRVRFDWFFATHIAVDTKPFQNKIGGISPTYFKIPITSEIKNFIMTNKLRFKCGVRYWGNDFTLYVSAYDVEDLVAFKLLYLN